MKGDIDYSPTDLQLKRVATHVSVAASYVFVLICSLCSLVSVLWSKPISKDGWVGFRPQDEAQIYDDGTMNPRFSLLSQKFIESATLQSKLLEKEMEEKQASTS